MMPRALRAKARRENMSRATRPPSGRAVPCTHAGYPALRAGVPAGESGNWARRGEVQISLAVVAGSIGQRG